CVASGGWSSPSSVISARLTKGSRPTRPGKESTRGDSGFVELSVLGTFDERIPFLGGEHEDRTALLSAVAHTDVAIDESDLDAGGVGALSVGNPLRVTEVDLVSDVRLVVNYVVVCAHVSYRIAYRWRTVRSPGSRIHPPPRRSR